jgi:TolB protein
MGLGAMRCVVGALFCSLFFGVVDVCAQTDLYVRGAGRLIPLAVQTLCIEGEEGGPEERVPSTIAKDLDVSGFFELLSSKSFIEGNTRCRSEATVYSDWSVLGVEGVVKGHVRGERGRLQVQLFLHDVQKQVVVLAKQYEGSWDQLQDMGHRFANEVVRHYTGLPGVFGTKLAFSSRVGRFKELFVMGIDGTGIKQLTNDRGLALSPAWNPEGDKIIFTSYRNRVPDLFLYDLKTQRSKQLTRTKDLEIGAHFLNSEQIVFSVAEGADSDIVVMNLDGTGLRRLTPKNRAIDVSPVPSVDGSKIAFCSNRGGSPQIYVMNRDGSNPRRISFGASSYCTSPAWSPDGSKIAFVCRADRGFNIFVSDADGSNPVQLTSSGDNEDPEFSPDGRYLSFATTQFGGRFSLAIMQVDGTSIKKVSDGRGGDFEPSWSPMPGG